MKIHHYGSALDCSPDVARAYDYVSRCLATRTREWEKQQKQNKALRTALADAIRSPMGVIPESAEGLITVAELYEAERRRADG